MTLMRLSPKDRPCCVSAAPFSAPGTIPPPLRRMNDMTAPTIGFIGAGNMATSLIGGMLQNSFKPSQILASDRDSEQLQRLNRQFGIATSTDNDQLAADCDVLVLAVKPQVMQAVCAALPSQRKPGQLVISIAAGIACRSLAEWLGADTAIIRCMPNTSSLRGQGVS